MTFSGNLAGISLADVFQNILGNRLTGTLVISVTGGQRFIYFDQGLVTRFSFGANKGLAIGDHLVQRQYITEEQLDRARKRKAKQNCTLRTALQGMDLLDPDQFTAAAAELIQEQLYDLLSLKQAEFNFEEGKPPARVFDREQTAADIRVDPSAILMEGARRVDEFSRIHKVVTDDRDIFVALEGWDEYELEEIQRTVAQMLDGRTEVGAILEALPFSRFEVLKSINDLVRFDLARPLTGRELEEMAQEALKSGEPDDAVALLQRALMIERSNKELRVRLAELLDQTGRSADAATEYAVLGYQEAQVGEIERALEYYSRATALKPEDIGVHEKQVELMAQHQHEDHAVELLRLAAKLVDAGLLDKARASLMGARDLLGGRDRIDLECQIALVEEQLGNGEGAAQIYRQLAKQVAASDEAAQLSFLRRAAELLPKDETLQEQIDDLESGRAQRRRQRRRWILRGAAVVMVTLGLGVMGLVELVASHRIISGLQHLASGHSETAIRNLRAVHSSFAWTLAGQRAHRLQSRVIERQLDHIEDQLAEGRAAAALATAADLHGVGIEGDSHQRLQVITARAERMAHAARLFEKINRERPDAAACTEYAALTARELTPLHVARLALGPDLRPRARRILLEVLERLDDARALATVAHTYVTTDDPVASETARTILSRAGNHRAAGREALWRDVYPQLQAAAQDPETQQRARAALGWLQGPKTGDPGPDR